MPDVIRNLFKKRAVYWYFGTIGFVVLLLPFFVIHTITYTQAEPPTFKEEFPITVDPLAKTIIEDPHVEAYLQGSESPLQAAAIGGWHALKELIRDLAVALSDTSLYQQVAFVGENKIVVTYSGMRKEEVAEVFARALKWTDKDKRLFMSDTAEPKISEGMYIAGTYVVHRHATPAEVRGLISKRFMQEIGLRYTGAIESRLPLEQALIIASLIQRETIGPEDMREVSGVIWNRLFIDMNLQLDASLQYAKATKSQVGSWWPKVLSKDKYIKSSYNTYENEGLPPGPIANPSVAAVVAALNPIQTECLYYFHDSKGDFHCSRTYEEHVAKLKKIYGRGR